MHSTLALTSLYLLTSVLAGCYQSESTALSRSTGGDLREGEAAIAKHGCGSCHTIPGVRRATGRVGPPLTGFSERMYIAGTLANTPENLVRWLKDPPAIEPRTAMPNVGLDDREASDIAAYLYTLP